MPLQQPDRRRLEHGPSDTAVRPSTVNTNSSSQSSPTRQTPPFSAARRLPLNSSPSAPQSHSQPDELPTYAASLLSPLSRTSSTSIPTRTASPPPPSYIDNFMFLSDPRLSAEERQVLATKHYLRVDRERRRQIAEMEARNIPPAASEPRTGTGMVGNVREKPAGGLRKVWYAIKYI